MAQAPGVTGAGSLSDWGRFLAERRRLLNNRGRFLAERRRLLNNRGRFLAERRRLLNNRGRFPVRTVLAPYPSGAGLKILPEPATHFGLLCIPAALVPPIKSRLLHMCP